MKNRLDQRGGKMPKPYKVVKCPKCQKPSVKMAYKKYTCPYCGYKTQMHRLYKWGNILKEFDTWTQAQQYLQQIVGLDLIWYHATIDQR